MDAGALDTLKTTLTQFLHLLMIIVFLSLKEILFIKFLSVPFTQVSSNLAIFDFQPMVKPSYASKSD